jgi:hypothetical protein
MSDHEWVGSDALHRANPRVTHRVRLTTNSQVQVSGAVWPERVKAVFWCQIQIRLLEPAERRSGRAGQPHSPDACRHLGVSSPK